MSDCATVFNLNDSTLSFGHEECWYHTMVRREVVSSDGKISDSTVAANDIQVDRNINVSGVKLVRDLLVQATDEMEYEEQHRSSCVHASRQKVPRCSLRPTIVVDLFYQLPQRYPFREHNVTKIFSVLPQ